MFLNMNILIIIDFKDFILYLYMRKIFWEKFIVINNFIYIEIEFKDFF